MTNKKIFIRLEGLSKFNKSIVLDLLNLTNSYIKYNEKTNLFNFCFYSNISNTDNKKLSTASSKLNILLSFLLIQLSTLID
jgi:hypothetical protein